MSRMTVKVQEYRVRVATIGIQGPPGGDGAGIAYVDAGDAASRQRSNPTGTQPSSTISDFATAADARIEVQKGPTRVLSPTPTTALRPAAARVTMAHPEKSLAVQFVVQTETAGHENAASTRREICLFAKANPVPYSSNVSHADRASGAMPHPRRAMTLLQ
jgi:hypothetical protein